MDGSIPFETISFADEGQISPFIICFPLCSDFIAMLSASPDRSKDISRACSAITSLALAFTELPGAQLDGAHAHAFLRNDEPLRDEGPKECALAPSSEEADKIHNEDRMFCCRNRGKAAVHQYYYLAVLSAHLTVDFLRGRLRRKPGPGQSEQQPKELGSPSDNGNASAVEGSEVRCMEELKKKKKLQDPWYSKAALNFLGRAPGPCLAPKPPFNMVWVATNLIGWKLADLGHMALLWFCPIKQHNEDLTSEPFGNGL
ncbi:hypothetical protein A6R68_13017 [Neotoma lepida]|uniref:Uncharacterized protein n=1 Tax=Neotoma lepida TaxID=56216 RepID=A0A1A6H1E7_NEOLE|nr:hypothetical protein A6R68_13017 [Neotoma lepida]